MKTKSCNFAVRIVKLYKYLQNNHREFCISTQLLKSGTAIGALICEAEFAESRKDFIHKLRIALKEANESVYWIELLFRSSYITQRMYNSILGEAVELVKMLISSVKTSSV